MDYNSSKDVLTQQIKEFQKEHGLYEDGKLTSSTKNEIDKAMLASDSEKILLKKDTKVFLKPMSGSSYFVLTDDTNAYILDNSIKGWAYIMTDDGMEGFINMEIKEE